MNKIIFILAFLILSIAAVGFADDVQQVITLKDGSQIKGSLAGINNGVYTLKAPIIGDVHVAASDVVSITNGNTAPSQGTGTSTFDQQIASTQQQLMSNPQSMQLLTEMAQNPEIAQALQDPSLQQAVQTHDYQAVQSNPAIQKLMSNPQMQALVQKLAAQQQQHAAASQ